MTSSHKITDEKIVQFRQCAASYLNEWDMTNAQWKLNVYDFILIGEVGTMGCQRNIQFLESLQATFAMPVKWWDQVEDSSDVQYSS